MKHWKNLTMAAPLIPPLAALSSANPLEPCHSSRTCAISEACLLCSRKLRKKYAVKAVEVSRVWLTGLQSAPLMRHVSVAFAVVCWCHGNQVVTDFFLQFFFPEADVTARSLKDAWQKMWMSSQ
jgi:hypothetical protein